MMLASRQISIYAGQSPAMDSFYIFTALASDSLTTHSLCEVGKSEVKRSRMQSRESRPTRPNIFGKTILTCVHLSDVPKETIYGMENTREVRGRTQCNLIAHENLLRHSSQACTISCVLCESLDTVISLHFISLIGRQVGSVHRCAKQKVACTRVKKEECIATQIEVRAEMDEYGAGEQKKTAIAIQVRPARRWEGVRTVTVRS